MRRLITIAIAATVLAGCGSPMAEIGSLTLDPPDGWLVTDRQPDSIKVTNGTIGDENATQAGTATAVFDVYVDSEQTVEEFRKVLDENNVRAKEDELKIDGRDAVSISYASQSFSPSMEVVFIPDEDVRIVYRAAFTNADAAFAKHRPDFHRALRSITFSGSAPA